MVYSQPFSQDPEDFSSGFFVYIKNVFYICGMKLSLTYNIRIENEKFGTIFNETFVDPTQFKLFLKLVHGCLELKGDLDFFNGTDFLVHVPYRYLVDSVVLTSMVTPQVLGEASLSEHMRSKVEALVTK
jgi:hypothetical protein